MSGLKTPVWNVRNERKDPRELYGATSTKNGVEIKYEGNKFEAHIVVVYAFTELFFFIGLF